MNVYEFYEKARKAITQRVMKIFEISAKKNLLVCPKLLLHKYFLHTYTINCNYDEGGF